MARNTPTVDGVTWWSYVQRISEGAPNVRIAEMTGVSPSSISRWRAGGVDAATAASFARGFGRPVLEAFIAAGFLTPDEAGQRPASAPSLTELDDDDLLKEVGRRMREGGSSASTGEPGEKSPGGGGNVVKFGPGSKRAEMMDSTIDHPNAADHPDADPAR